MLSNRNLISQILVNDVDAINASLPDCAPSILIEPITKVIFHENTQLLVKGKPLFIALLLGQFAAAKCILSYLKGLAVLNAESVSAQQFSDYYTDDNIDVLSVVESFLETHPDHEDAHHFIDEFYGLLPLSFQQKNPCLFKVEGTNVDFFTKLFFIKPERLAAVLKDDSFPVLNVQSCIQPLLHLSAIKGYKGIFDLLLKKMSNVDISTFRCINGNSLIHDAIPEKNLYLLSDLLRLDANKNMLEARNNKDQTPFDVAVMSNNFSALALMTLYQINCNLYALLRDIVAEKSQAPAASAGIFSFFTASSTSSQIWKILTAKLDTEDDFYGRFFFEADFSGLNVELDAKKSIRFILGRIGLVSFSFMDKGVVQKDSLKGLLDQGTFSSSWNYLLDEVINRWQHPQVSPSIRL